ncbi:MAG: hypothetical protein ACE5OS_03155 [Anaerolineae bacterium]
MVWHGRGGRGKLSPILRRRLYYSPVSVGVADFSDYDGSAVPSLFEVDYHGAKYRTAVGSYDTGAVVQTQEYHLQLIGSDCAPIENARVNLQKADGGYVTYVRTDGEGVASFQVVPEAEMKLELDYHGATYATPVTEVSEDTQLEVQTVPLTAHLTVQGTDLADQRVDLLKSNEAYVTYTRTGSDGSASFEVLPGAEHKLRSTYDGETWVSEGVAGLAEVEHDFG